MSTLTSGCFLGTLGSFFGILIFSTSRLVFSE